MAISDPTPDQIASSADDALRSLVTQLVRLKSGTATERDLWAFLRPGHGAYRALEAVSALISYQTAKTSTPEGGRVSDALISRGWKGSVDPTAMSSAIGVMQSIRGDIAAAHTNGDLDPAGSWITEGTEGQPDWREYWQPGEMTGAQIAALIDQTKYDSVLSLVDGETLEG